MSGFDFSKINPFSGKDVDKAVQSTHIDRVDPNGNNVRFKPAPERKPSFLQMFINFFSRKSAKVVPDSQPSYQPIVKMISPIEINPHEAIAQFKSNFDSTNPEEAAQHKQTNSADADRFAKKLVLNGAPLLTSPEFSNVSILEGFKGLLNETKPYDLEGSNTIEAAFDGKDSISNVLDSVSETDSSLFTSIMKALNQRTMASVYAKFTMPLMEGGFSPSEDKSKDKTYSVDFINGVAHVHQQTSFELLDISNPSAGGVGAFDLAITTKIDAHTKDVIGLDVTFNATKPFGGSNAFEALAKQLTFNSDDVASVASTKSLTDVDSHNGDLTVVGNDSGIIITEQADFTGADDLGVSTQSSASTKGVGSLKVLSEALNFTSALKGGGFGKTADTTGRKLFALAQSYDKLPSEKLQKQIASTLDTYRDKVDQNAKMGSDQFLKLHERLTAFEDHFSALSTSNEDIQTRLDDMESTYYKTIIKTPYEESSITLDFNDLQPEQIESTKVNDFSGLKRLMSGAKRSLDKIKTAAFLRVFNRDVAPKLTQEMDALEYLSIKTAYLNLNKGDIVDLNIQQSGRDTAYGTSYQVQDKLITHDGLVAYTFMPVKGDPLEEDPDKVPIMVFRGTASGMDKLAKQENHGTGMKADLDSGGIGKSLFENNKEAIMGWVNGYTQSGRKVAVMGHSLGGALASRVMCESDQQDLIEVTTFQAPALDKETAAKFDSSNAKNVTHQVVGRDIVTSAGKQHLEGRVWYVKGTGNPKNNHLDTPCTKALLNGESSIRKGGEIKTRTGGRIVEGARAYILSLFSGWVSA